MAIMIRAETMKKFDLRHTNTIKAKKVGRKKLLEKKTKRITKTRIMRMQRARMMEKKKKKDENKNKEQLTQPPSRVIYQAAISRSLPRSNLRLRTETHLVVHPNPTPSGLGAYF